MSDLLNDPLIGMQHCRDRAKEVRAQAADIHDEIARAQMLAIAESYERLAEQAEERTKSNKPKDYVGRAEPDSHSLVTRRAATAPRLRLTEA
jgi:hypothetical protein